MGASNTVLQTPFLSEISYMFVYLLWFCFQMNHCLSNIVQNEVGRDFMDFIRRQPTVTAKPEDFLFEEFARSKKQE